MILVDANLLVYAHSEAMPQHDAALAWLQERLNGSARVGLPWTSLLAFLRIVANPRVFDPPVSGRQAWAKVGEWLACPPVWIPGPTERHSEILDELFTEHDLTGNDIPDAHLAALAIEHGLVLATTDGDFARFSALRCTNPLS